MLPVGMISSDSTIPQVTSTNVLVAAGKITLNEPANRPVKHTVSTRKGVAGKKTSRNGKLRPIQRLTSSKTLPKDNLPVSDSKKLKPNQTTPTPGTPISNDGDYNATSSVPSVASTFSTEDSDLPDSIVSPTDEETCSYVTDVEEEFDVAGDAVSSCSDFDSPNAITSKEIHDELILPPLRFSFFPHVPPYLNFCLHDEKVMELPWSVRRNLKWKLSTITPAVVRKTVVNSGFRVIKDPKDWSGTWGKHMKSAMFKLVPPHQKVNHFPGTFQIGRKDRMWRNMQKMVTKFGVQEFGFLPQTYVLPHDLRLLRQVWSRSTVDVPWIIKPPASARGTGIQVIHQWNQLPRKRPLVVQSYVENPYLINNTKFDIRLYVFVTSVNPLRIYLFEDGLVRFASMAYSSEMDSLSDLYVHLTNYSINKNSGGYVPNEEPNMCQGHKWTLKSLWTYMSQRGIDVEGIKSSIRDIVIKTFLSVDSTLLDMAKGNVTNRYTCYELFGFDILLDANLKPWLLEVNISPSLHSTSSLDLSVKGPLIRDVFNMARFHVPSSLNSASKQQLSEYVAAHFARHVQTHSPGTDDGSQYCINLSLYDVELKEEDQKKQELFQNQIVTGGISSGNWMVEEKPSNTVNKIEPSSNIFNELTSNDLQILVETEDEISQAKGFTRIFPSEGSDRYFRFMDNVRYYNMLLDQWEKKFPCHSDRTAAIDFINNHLKLSLGKTRSHIDL